MDNVWTFDGVEIGVTLAVSRLTGAADLDCEIRGGAATVEAEFLIRKALSFGTGRMLRLSGTVDGTTPHALNGVRLIGVRGLVLLRVRVDDRVHEVNAIITRRRVMARTSGQDAAQRAAPLRLSIA